MYHSVQLNADVWVDLERSPKLPIERVLLRGSATMRAQIRPHVINTGTEMVEMADLFFEDGTTARCIPFAWFTFVE